MRYELDCGHERDARASVKEVFSRTDFCYHDLQNYKSKLNLEKNGEKLLYPQ